jgi:hypothetical protein
MSAPQPIQVPMLPQTAAIVERRVEAPAPLLHKPVPGPLPPSVLRIRVADGEGHSRVGLWIPLFLIWPVALVLYALLLPLIVAVSLMIWPSGYGKPLLLGGPCLFRVFWSLKGTEINVHNPTNQVIVSVQ